jgi:hypothetical protein
MQNAASLLFSIRNYAVETLVNTGVIENNGITETEFQCLAL